MKKVSNWHSFFISVQVYFWFRTVFSKPSEVSTICFFFRENLETLFTEIWWYSCVKIWPSITNECFHRKHAHVLFYFCRRYSVKLGPKKWWYSRDTLEIRTWKPVGWYSLKHGFFLVTLPKKTRFRWKHPTGFKFLLQSITWNHQFLVRVSLKLLQKKRAVSP